MDITIVGLGAVGSTVTALVNREVQHSVINIMDPNPHIHGRYLDLAHAASIENNTLQINNEQSFNDAQIIFYCAGIRNAKEASRSSVVQQNKRLVKKVFSRAQFTRQPLIINLVNPVEAIALWIHNYVSDSATVTATGTGLDSYRLRYLIHDFYNVPIDEIEALVVGEHGTEMIPVFSQMKIGKEKAKERLNADDQQNLKNALINTAKTIRATEKATKYGVADTAVKIFTAYISDHPLLLPTAIYSPEINDQRFYFPKPIFINLPTQVGQNKIWYMPVNFDEQELKNIAAAISSISKTSEA